jgi:hypothetical protein
LDFASVLASLGGPLCRIGVSGGENSVSGVVLVSMLPTGDALGSMTCPRSTLPTDASAVILILASVPFIAREMNRWQVGYYADSYSRTCVLSQGRVWLMSVTWEGWNTQHSCCGTSYFKIKH